MAEHDEAAPTPEPALGSTPIEVVERLVAAIETGDVDAVRAIYAPDARIWHNFDEIDQTVDENLRTLAWMCKVLSDRRYEIQRREPLAGGSVLQQHILRGTVIATGEAFALAAVLVVTVEDDRVTRLEEYLDTARAAALSKR